MISRIRSTFHTSAYKLILWTILIIFIASSLGLGLLFRDTDNVIMYVNNYSITKPEFSYKVKEKENHIAGVRQQFGGYAEQILVYMGLSGDPVQLALNDLVREKLLLSAAQEMGLKDLSSNYIIKKINNSNFALQHLAALVPEYFYNSLGELNEIAVTNHLSRHKISSAHFKTMLEEALLQFFVMSLVPTTLYVSPALLQDSLQQNRDEKRTYKFVELRIDDYVKDLKKTKVSDAELKDYFNKHNKATKRYWSNETRSGKVFKFSLSGYGIKDLAKEKFEQRFMGDARRVIAQNNENSLREFVQKHGGKESVVTNKARATSADQDYQLLEKLFSVKALEKSAVVFFGEHGYIVTLTGIQERSLVPFETVSEQVVQDLLKEKAIQKLESQSGQLSQNNNPQGVKEFFDSFNGVVRTLSVQKPAESKNWDELKKNGMPIDRMKRMIHPGYAILYGLKNNAGIGVLVMESREKAPVQEDQESYASSSKNMYRQELGVSAAAFIDSLQKNATIIPKEMPRS